MFVRSYGYRGKDCRSNVFMVPTGEVVYFVASVVVLFNIEEHGNLKRFFVQAFHIKLNFFHV